MNTEPQSERTALLLGGTPSDLGLLYGVQFLTDGGIRELELPEVAHALSQPSRGIWLHFNLSNARARALLAHAHFLPPMMRSIFEEQEMRRRIDITDVGIVAIVSDLIFEREAEPGEVAPLWLYASPQLIVSARMHPLKTTDELRAAVRNGLRINDAIDLLVWILAQRTESLSQLTQSMSDQVSEIEDEILGGAIKEQRVQLGRIRRFCARLRRHFAPERTSFLRLIAKRPHVLSDTHSDALRNEIESLSFLVDEGSELYERAKLLQEELASRVAEDTGRNLYVLAILSAVFLPMTLITGIFGMNVAGLPGLHNEGGFWWVMVLIIAAGGITLASIFSRGRN